MSTAITHTQSIDQPFTRARTRAERWPWAHPGVASERASRAERAYAGELVHAEHHARTRAAAREARR
jgi:hypothetical protein